MKKLLMILSIAFISSCAFAATPPAAVTKAFAKKFPTATKISWGVEGPKEWEAEFTFDGNKISANFSEDGNWVETEREIKVADLPKSVLTAVKSKFYDWKIAEADKTESSKHGTFYEVDLKKGMKHKSLAFKEDGTSIKE